MTTAVTVDRPGPHVGETALPDVVLEAAAAASGVDVTMVESDVSDVVRNGPRQLTIGDNEVQP